MKTIQVIKLQIDLLGLDIENLQNDDKIEALEEMERTLSILESMKRCVRADSSQAVSEVSTASKQLQM